MSKHRVLMGVGILVELVMLGWCVAMLVGCGPTTTPPDAPAALDMSEPPHGTPVIPEPGCTDCHPPDGGTDAL